MKKKLLAGTVLSICLLSSGLSACSSEDKTENHLPRISFNLIHGSRRYSDENGEGEFFGT